MMWLLAESWGRVTPAGVTLPVVLTHEALGALIGARRPTVSLALAELMERGAVVRQRTGWLLLESLPETTVTDGQSEPPVLLDHEKSIWDSPSPPSPSPQELIGAEFLETLSRLRDQVGRVRAETDATLADVRSSRERTRVRRAQAAARSLSRRRAPSSG
jgi:hypothetical protein